MKQPVLSFMLTTGEVGQGFRLRDIADSLGDKRDREARKVIQAIGNKRAHEIESGDAPRNRYEAKVWGRYTKTIGAYNRVAAATRRA